MVWVSDVVARCSRSDRPRTVAAVAGGSSRSGTTPLITVTVSPAASTLTSTNAVGGDLDDGHRFERDAVGTRDKEHHGQRGIGIDHHSTVGVGHVRAGAADDHHPGPGQGLAVDVRRCGARPRRRSRPRKDEQQRQEHNERSTFTAREPNMDQPRREREIDPGCSRRDRRSATMGRP